MPVLLLGVLIAALDIAILGPALRAIAETFLLDERAVAWVFIVFSLFSQLGNPIMSGLSDSYGRRLAFGWCIGLFVVGTLIVVFSPTFFIMLVGRAFQGAGVSGIFPITGAVIGDLFPVERRGRMLGIVGAVFGVAFIIGPIVSGVMLQWFSWRSLFVVTLPLALYVGIVGVPRLPHVRAERVARLDWPGVLALGAAMACFTFAINQVDAERIGASLLSLRVGPFLGATVLFFALFLAIERRGAHPFIRLGLFRSRQVVIACLVSTGAGATEAVFVFLPSFAVVAFGVADRAASFMLLPLVTALAIGSPLCGRLIDRLGSRAVVLGGTAVTAAGLAVTGMSTDSIGLYYAGGVLIGLGLSAILGSALSYIVLNEAQPGERTVVQGVVRLFKAVGRLLGGALIGAVAASGGGSIGGYARAFAVIAIGMGLMHALAYGLKRRGEEKEG
ncbi:MAG: MFS transporter [Rhodothermales bacterium]|nr:MFS transporter [Rhodothermales bacterium]